MFNIKLSENEINAIKGCAFIASKEGLPECGYEFSFNDILEVFKKLGASKEEIQELIDT